MERTSRENNRVSLTGTVATGFSYSHEVYGEKFYVTYLSIERLSGIADLIPVVVSERLLDCEKDITGKWVHVEGHYRSFNFQSKLILTVFAKKIKILKDGCLEDENEIFLNGFICKPTVYRKTPLHEREIADVFIAVNRPYGKSDYIPCICWGKYARLAKDYKVGDHIEIYGRIQSREYIKRYEDLKEELKTAYEVSAFSVRIAK